MRLFAMMLPTTLYGFYITMIALSNGIWWSTPLIFGGIALAGITGWLASYLVFTPSELLLSMDGQKEEGTS